MGQVHPRIDQGEDELTEFKEASAPSAPDKVAVAACAFANSDGGLVILGVDDQRRIVGVPRDPEQVQEALANLLANSLNISLPARPGRHQSPDGWVHWIEVQKYRGPERCDIGGVLMSAMGDPAWRLRPPSCRGFTTPLALS